MRKKSNFSESKSRSLGLLICIMSLVICVSSCAYRPKVTVLQLPPEEQKVITVPEKIVIEAGEKLVYTVDWRGIYAGEIVLHVKKIEKFQDRDCYYIVAEARPNRFFRFFYNVKYIVETYIDKETKQPLRFYKKRTLGRKITEETISFDYKNSIAIWEYTGSKSKTIKLPQGAQDLLSSLYYFRLEGFTLGDEYPFDIVYNSQIWRLNAKIDTLELVKMYHKNAIKAYTVKLSSKLSAHLTGEQKIKIYFSMRQKHTPLFFNFNTKIGPLHGVLQNMPKEELDEGCH